MRKEKGITLVSLVVTIILLIILAGISINLLLGENGIITKAKQAKENIELAKKEEENYLNNLYDEMIINGAIEGNSYDAILKIAEFKAAIAKAITDQKVETSSEDTIDTMASNIEKILQVRTQDATATAKDISVGKTAYVNGEKITGTIEDTTIEDEVSIIPLKEKYYLYNLGNQYTEITGGWNIGYNPGYTTLTFKDSYMEFTSKNGNNSANLNTTNAIDISNYSRLYFELTLSGSEPNFGIMTNPGYRLQQPNNGYVTIVIHSSDYRETLENGHYLYCIDIEDVIGNQYVVLDNYMSTINVYSVYLR